MALAANSRRLLLGLGLAVLGCALGVYLAGRPARENARLRQQLLHQRERTRALHGHLDTLQAELARPAPTTPAPRTYSL